VTTLDHPLQGAALTDEMLLADEFVQRPGSHARRERGMGGRAREIERLLIVRGARPQWHDPMMARRR